MTTDHALIKFITRRLDEDEQFTKAATPGPWAAPVREMDGRTVVSITYTGDAHGWVGSTPVMSEDESRSWADQEHIARHDPARVLREIEAKRKILAEHTPGTDPCDAHDASMHTIPCDTLLYLAAIWADHADYQQTWAP